MTLRIFIPGILLFCFSCKQNERSFQDWSSYLGDKSSSQYSPLDQINLENAANLEVTWIYRSGDSDSLNRTQIQCNPLVIDGVLYGSSPKLAFFALDAQTGKELWNFDPFEGSYDQYFMGVNRGVAYWREGDDQRILFTAGSTLFAVDASTGTPVNAFGDSGKVDLRLGLGRDLSKHFIVSNTPGVVYKNLLILGTRVDEGFGAAPGHVRAYNILTGIQEWIFHTIPQPGEFGIETWPDGAWESAGGANAWAGISLDEQRGIAFVPTGSASYDFYGADRHGENLFANSIVALDALTGERKWHFQTVHHDLWDRDLPAPPNLTEITVDGVKRDVVAQITKSGYVFVLDRETGEPVFDIVEEAVPESNLIGERAWPTQPRPVKPPPFVRQKFEFDDINNMDSMEYKFVVDQFQGKKNKHMYEPPSEVGTLIFPGYDGGGEWGGAAVDPDGILYVNASEMPWILTMVPVYANESDYFGRGKAVYRKFCVSCHGINREGGEFMGTIPSLTNLHRRMSKEELEAQIIKGNGLMPSFGHIPGYQLDMIREYLWRADSVEEQKIESTEKPDRYLSTGYFKFKDNKGYPAIKPPWGTLNAVDLNKGEIKWSVPFGVHEELVAKGIPATGTENYGGPVVTKGGLIFIAATEDEMFRVFNSDNGKILFEYKLPAAGYATPSTYMVNGKQYVVIACGGGKLGTKSGDSYVAFALPE